MYIYNQKKSPDFCVIVRSRSSEACHCVPKLYTGPNEVRVNLAGAETKFTFFGQMMKESFHICIVNSVRFLFTADMRFSRGSTVFCLFPNFRLFPNFPNFLVQIPLNQSVQDIK